MRGSSRRMSIVYTSPATIHLCDNCTKDQRHRCSLSIHSSTITQTSTTVQSITQPPTPSTYFPSGYTTHHIIQSRGWSEYDRHLNPLLVQLRGGRSKPRVWLSIYEGEYNKYEKGTNKATVKAPYLQLQVYFSS